MRAKKLFVAAFKSIRKNGMRSLLTMLGIIIGVSAVIIMVAVGQGAQVAIEEQISSLGTNLIMVQPGAERSGGVSRGSGSRKSLTLEDVDMLKEEASLLMYVSPEVRVNAQVIGGGNNWSTSIIGVGATYLEIRDWELDSGTFFIERDEKALRKVAVLGQDVVEALFPDQDAVGQQIRIRNVPFKVIGVLKSKGSTAMGSQDDRIFVPGKTALYRLSGDRYISSIEASAVSMEQMDAAQEEMAVLLRQSHRLRDGEDNDFHIRTQSDLVSRASSMTTTLTLLLGAIAGVSLIVGGIGVMNIMLVSVTERTREIGIRLAIGGRGRDILTQFLVEAVVLSALGGTMGIAFGMGVAELIERFTGLTTVVNTMVIVLAFGFSGAVGVFFGFYPARKAAALNPIDALRYE